jgi:UDP-3-O-[3-hydroxymyristoyl] N-acetylglucosamine deacetylase
MEGRRMSPSAYQTTICGPVDVSGIGLHSGLPSAVQLRPAPPDSGVVFFDTEAPSLGPTPAHISRLLSTTLSTRIGDDQQSFGTIEHLLSAVRGLQVDNLEVWLTGPELPILDGTAGAWCRLLRTAQLQPQEAPRLTLVIDRPIRVTAGDSWIEARPAAALELELCIDFDHPLIGLQRLEWSAAVGDYGADLAWARTFGFERELAKLKGLGLIAGGSLDNAVVFSESGVLNPGGLRSPDEPVRHKAMDMLGDLALLGHPVRGRLVAHRPGHAIVSTLVRTLLDEPEAWHLESAAAP